MEQDQILGCKTYGSFTASSRVRTNSTLESVTIFKTEMEKYRRSYLRSMLILQKMLLLKGMHLRFETLGGLLGMLEYI